MPSLQTMPLSNGCGRSALRQKGRSSERGRKQMARKKRVFTAEECAFITREYGRTPSSQIAQKLGRRQSAISGKAHALGLGPLCLQRRFTPEEDALIRQDYAAFVPMDEIANKLGRSVS